ncbi:MAG TPA: PIG-L family deacetylase, partial [Acidimicrobiales bacterium]
MRCPPERAATIPAEGTSLNLETPARALAVAAHPDDVEFGCGATLAKWARAGCQIHHLICTDGAKGSWDP